MTDEMADLQQRIMKPEEVYERLGLSKVTVWRMRKQGEFPPPIRLSGGRVGWPEQVIADWIASRSQA